MIRDAFIGRLVCLLMALVLPLSSTFAKDFSMSSPNGKIRLALKIDDSDGTARILAAYKGKKQISMPSVRLGLRTNSRDFSQGLELVSASFPRKIKDSYKMITGKRSLCSNSASESTLRFKNPEGDILDVVLRACDDGLALKYVVEARDGESVTNEVTAYEIEDGKKRWASMYDPRSYENFYEVYTEGSKNARGNDWQYPMLVENGEGVFALISESNIRRGNCASYLNNASDFKIYNVSLADKPLGIKGAWESPWRLMIMGSLAGIVESTLVNDLADPSKIKDTSWIEPACVSWIYWANNFGSKDFKIVKEYIDLAQEMKWPYCLIDCQWHEMKNGGNIDDAIAYAKQKNVKLLLWYNSSTIWLAPEVGPLFKLNDPDTREVEFAWLNKNSVRGIKVDFFDGDFSKIMNYCIDLLEDGARHKLMLNFHGATIPRGWQRTYPNLMSVEGVYGAEWYNNGPILTERAAAHNVNLVFTRNVVGSMDYTPGTFSDSQHKHITTYAHELALTVLFESALQHMPDRLSAYKALPEQVRNFLSNLPTAWDDTKLLSGYPEKEAVIARRKGGVWYVAGINGTDKERTIKLNLKALKSKSGDYIIFKDGQDSKSFDIQNAKRTNEILEVKCLPRGGFTLVLR